MQTLWQMQSCTHLIDFHQKLNQELTPTEGRSGCLLQALCFPKVFSNPSTTAYEQITILTRFIDDEEFTCISLGTGMRCLPASKVPLANGRCLHDWHAEIVSIRAFNLFLIEQCALLAANPEQTSPWIRRKMSEEMSELSSQPFAFQDNIHIDMFCSESPCGDASMELVMNAQADATPWQRDAESGSLTGRGYFSELGVVRRKPARGDSPHTLSKSCSDKLALKQCTSLLSSLSSILLCPARFYLRSLVVPSSRLSQSGMARAFGREGRMQNLDCSASVREVWNGGYSFRPFNVIETGKTFKFSRDLTRAGKKSSGTNITAMWTPEHFEVLIGGTLQGFKQFSTRGSSLISNARLWHSVVGIAQLMGSSQFPELLECTRYGQIKTCEPLAQRRKVKDYVRGKVLKNWIRNNGDENFQLEELEPA